jgi:hypothetical protein
MDTSRERKKLVYEHGERGHQMDVWEMERREGGW